MRIFQIMGCTSDQYASLERYLVKKAEICKERGDLLIVGYNNIPQSREFIEDLKNAGGLLYKIEAKSFFDFSFYKKFYQIIKKHNVNVLHAYFAPTRHYAVMAAWLLGVPKIFRQGANLPLSQNKLKGVKLKIFLFKHRFLSLFADKYICRSNAVKNQYIQMGIDSKKVIVADGGTDTNRYRRIDVDRRELIGSGIEPDAIVLGTASRLVKEKKIERLILALKKVKSKYNFKIYCVIFGYGHERQNLLSLIKDLDLQKEIFLLGHKNNLEKYYNVMDIYVSTSDSEGMSNSILEAMACEKPVILSDIEPNIEIFEKARENELYIGEIFNRNDIENLSNKLLKLLDLKTKINEIGKNARSLVENYYSLDKRILKELLIYQME